MNKVIFKAIDECLKSSILNFGVSPVLPSGQILVLDFLASPNPWVSLLIHF